MVTQDEIELYYSLRNMCSDIKEKWGLEAQTKMVVEESAEFLDALMKFQRGRATKEELTEEFVDLTIMLEQVRSLYELEDIDIWKYKTMKIRRLRKRLYNEN